MPLAPATRARWHAVLACVGAAVLWWRFPGTLTLAIAAVAVLLALLAWCSPRHYAPVQRGFDAVVHALLVAITWTALALVYFGVLTPWRGWRAATGHDPLNRRRGDVESYLVPAPGGETRFDRQF